MINKYIYISRINFKQYFKFNIALDICNMSNAEHSIPSSQLMQSPSFSYSPQISVGPKGSDLHKTELMTQRYLPYS